jgi:Domain of unknown function (DUF4190)
MKCFVHPGINAVGTCVNCGQAVCTDCATRVGGKIYCKSCAASVAPLQQVSQTNGLAITSLVLSFLAVPSFFCYGAGALFGIAALITGLIARRQIKTSGNAQKGDGMALAGMIIGGVFAGLLILIIIVATILALLGPAIGNIFQNITNNI